MKILIVGSSNVVFVHAYVEEALNLGVEVDFWDVGVSCVELPSIYENINVFYDEVRSPSKISRIKMLTKKIKMDRFEPFIFMLDVFNHLKRPASLPDLVSSKLLESDYTHILYIWSTTLITQKKAIDLFCKSKGIKVSSSLVVNTYPVRSNVKFDNRYSLAWLDNNYFSSFDNVILSSREMSDFFKVNNISQSNNIFVFRDLLPSSYMGDSSDFNCNYGFELKNTEMCKLIFLGNTKFSERTIDDITVLITKLASENIEIWIQETTDPIVNIDNVKTFKPFSYEEISNGKFASFLQSFDAVLMAYNGLCNVRTETGFPTRFALGLLSEKPILLKKNTFTSIESEFRDEVITYNNDTHLLEICRDKELLIRKAEEIGSYKSHLSVDLQKLLKGSLQYE
ncbi:hypothetical protein [Photobacterium kagoshimensis]|uniref:hypothetical protein n=1 Tax=Photobacterium kagoshimensis TaxID=2910242 RepID=UPI003D120F91